MQEIIHSIQHLDCGIDSFILWRQNIYAFYSDDLSYTKVHNLNIGKGKFKSYFSKPKMAEEINEMKPHISIR